MNESIFEHPGRPPCPQIHISDPAITAGERQSEVMHILLSGRAIFDALKNAVDELKRLAPEDDDVLVEAFNISVTKIIFTEPHTITLRGFNHDGRDTFVIVHYSQLIAHVVFKPKRGKDRIIAGFSVQ